MDRIKKSDILIIKGVFAKDFLNESSIYANVRDQIMSTDYIPVPNRFTSADVWKKIHTNLLCWECGLEINSYPKFIPKNPRFESVENTPNKLNKQTTITTNTTDVCDVEEVFCEWNCVVRYIITRFDKIKAKDLLTSVSLFESLFTGKYREHIPPAL